MLKNSENNGTEEIGLVTPTPGLDQRETSVYILAADALVPSDTRGSFHYWESELTFGNLTNFWKLANQKVS